MPTNEDLDLRKALDTTTTALIPEIVSAGLRKFVETRSPVYNRTPKLNWPTNTYIFRSETALPSATFAADGATLPTATNATYAKPSVAMKYIYTRGEVTGPMQAAAGSLLDAMQLEIEAHADALVRKIEQTLISGDAGSTPTEFSGLITQITQAKAAGSVQLTLALMDETLDIPAEYPTDIILNRAMGRRLWSLLQAQQRFIDSTVISGGFRVPVYNELPILRVDNDITGLTTTIVFPDMRHVVMPINHQVEFEMLAKTKDSDDFMLKMYCTLAVEGAARYHVKMTGVTA